MYIRLRKTFFVLFLLFYVAQMVDYNNEQANVFIRGILAGLILTFCLMFFFMGYYEKEQKVK